MLIASHLVVLVATAALPVRGQHVSLQSHEGSLALERLLREQLAPRGVNLLVVEVNYGFRFASHPELSSGDLTREDARRIGGTCRELGVRIVPLFNCLGHQSWAETTFPLLTVHPEFDETPGIPLDNQGIYCRSWCPQHPEVNNVAFALAEELIEAFGSDAIHIGMDEVFLIAHEQCPRCRGGDPAALFAKAVNDWHVHFAAERGVEVFLWGDRLLDAETTGYGEWEASANGTAGAIEMIPKDIIICDWHYEPLANYPSVRTFEEKGFRVLPCPWRSVDAAEALLDCALEGRTDRLLGFLGTGWSAGDGGARLLARLSGEPGVECGEADVLEACLARLAEAE